MSLLLVDSHALLWAIYEPERLSIGAREAILDLGNKVYVSLATLWELAKKAAVYRLPMAGSSVPGMIERIEQVGVTFLPIIQADIVRAATLPNHHADPFDRMLVAQAQANSLVLVTKDAKITLYDVRVVWS